MKTLSARFYNYLKQKNTWVTEKELIIRSRKDYSYQEIQDALRAIQEHTGNKYLDIGDRWTKELGKEYRWYKMSEEDIKLKESAIECFDSC